MWAIDTLPNSPWLHGMPQIKVMRLTRGPGNKHQEQRAGRSQDSRKELKLKEKRLLSQGQWS